MTNISIQELLFPIWFTKQMALALVISDPANATQ
jgi:hypothetical protein